MHATAELQVVPVGEGVSLRKKVIRLIEILKDSGLQIETHAAGTDIEGEMEEILEALATIHEALHKEGSIRLLSTLKLEIRTDKSPSIAGKRL